MSTSKVVIRLFGHAQRCGLRRRSGNTKPDGGGRPSIETDARVA
jgi:hypothetical protein